MTIKANYSSRGYQVYGDVANVQKDSATLHEILDRQGSDLFLEVIANHVGNCAIKFKLDQKEVNEVTRSIVLSIEHLISERT